MSFTLDLVVRRTERALERVLGLAGRRGFEVVGVSARMNEDGRSLSVTLTLVPAQGERRAETLVRQLERLAEVESVTQPAVG
jgi:acetolactate synthase regulatory subunit